MILYDKPKAIGPDAQGNFGNLQNSTEFFNLCNYYKEISSQKMLEGDDNPEQYLLPFTIAMEDITSSLEREIPYSLQELVGDNIKSSTYQVLEVFYEDYGVENHDDMEKLLDEIFKDAMTAGKGFLYKASYSKEHPFATAYTNFWEAFMDDNEEDHIFKR